MEIAAALSVVALVLDLINGLTELQQKAVEVFSNRQKKTLRRALRVLEFSPDGVLRLIKEVAKSGNVNLDRHKDMIREFKEGESEVHAALSAVDFDRLSKKLRVTLETARQLQFVKDHKLEIRKTITGVLNEYDLGGRKASNRVRAELTSLVRQIERLNRAIRKLDKALATGEQ